MTSLAINVRCADADAEADAASVADAWRESSLPHAAHFMPAESVTLKHAVYRGGPN